MLPTKADVRLEGDLTGETIQMGIDTKSLAFLQKVLTDLYSDPKLAVIREYSTNAWDSHVEAGQQKPIEVSTPNHLTPFFTVKDYGIGLSLDNIRDIYSQYGASTKRNTNAQTGMLGLGCKSALTYTNQFTIIAIKDDIKTSVVVSRDEENVGAMTVVYHGPANGAPAGVEIKIPVNTGDTTEFRSKAEAFFSYWNKDRVLLNGRVPERVKGEELADGILLVKKQGYGAAEHKLVMGGVSYNISQEELFGKQFSTDRVNPNIRSNVGIVFFVEMGEVDFTPSREELHYTGRTRRLLKDRITNFNNALAKHISQDISTQPTPKEALVRYRTWQNTVNDMPFGLSYRGMVIPHTLDFDENYFIRAWGTNSHNSRIRKTILDVSSMGSDTYLVIGKDRDLELNTRHKAKLRIWADEKHNDDSPTFYFLGEDKYAPWTDSLTKVEWKEILQTKIPHSGIGAKSNTFYVITRNGREEIEAKNVPSNKPVIWGNLDSIHKDRMYAVWEWAERAGVTFLLIAKNKEKNFKDKFPNASFYTDWIRATIAAFNSSLTADDKKKLGMAEAHSFSALAKFDDSRIEDKDLRKFGKLAAEIKNQLQDRESAFFKLQRKYRNLRSMCISTHLDHGSLMVQLEDHSDIIDKYPLLAHIGEHHRTGLLNHLILYINAAHKEGV